MSLRSLIVAGCLLAPAEPATVRDPPRWIAELAAERGATRDSALAGLGARIASAAAMRELLEVARSDPEIESRGRAACEANAALAPVLAAIVRADRGDVQSLARRWLEAAIAAEIARRAPLDRLVARSGRTTLFTAGTVTGARLPRSFGLEGGLAVDRAFANLAARGDLERPIALDPALDLGTSARVSGAELLPSTAGGLLKRWLVPRGWKTVDLGLVHLVTTGEVEERIAAAREREVDANRRRRIEFDSARLLVERLTANAPGDDVLRLRLWRALALPGAESVARDLDDEDDPALRALGALAREATGDELVTRLSGLPESLVAEVIDALVRGPTFGAGRTAELVSDTSFLALRLRLHAAAARRLEDPAIGRLALSDPALRAIAVAAIASGAIEIEPEVEIPRDALAEAIEDTAIFSALATARPFDPRSTGASHVRAAVLRDPELGAVLRAFDAGAELVARRAAVPRIPDSPALARAFLLGVLAGSLDGEGSRPSPEVEAACARLAWRCPDLARAAVIAVAPRERLAAAARELVLGDELTLRAAVSRAAVLESSGDDSLAYALLFELRAANRENRTLSALYDELFAVVSVVDSGAVRWFDPYGRESR